MAAKHEYTVKVDGYVLGSWTDAEPDQIAAAVRSAVVGRCRMVTVQRGALAPSGGRQA